LKKLPSKSNNFNRSLMIPNDRSVESKKEQRRLKHLNSKIYNRRSQNLEMPNQKNKEENFKGKSSKISPKKISPSKSKGGNKMKKIQNHRSFCWPQIPRKKSEKRKPLEKRRKRNGLKINRYSSSHISGSSYKR